MKSGQEIVFVQKLNVNDLAELEPCTWGMDGQLGLCICENLYYSAICSQEFDLTNTHIHTRTHAVRRGGRSEDEFITATVLTNRC